MPHDPIDVLDCIAADAKEVWCLCDLQRAGDTSQLKLGSRGNGKSVEALICIPEGEDDWRVERENVATIADGLRALAARWEGELRPASIRTGAQKSPVRGDDLQTVFLAALHAGFDGNVPADVADAFAIVAEKYASGASKPITRKKRAPKKLAPPVKLPKAFDATNEKVTFLAQAKKRAAKNFKFTRESSLREAERLAFALYVFGRAREAEQVCRFLGRYEFQGNHSLWSPVSGALALLHRLAKVRGNRKTAADCRRRMLEVSPDIGEAMANSRGHSLEHALMYCNEGNRTWERKWRMIHLSVLETLIAVGGTKDVPLKTARAEYDENLARLNELLGL